MNKNSNDPYVYPETSVLINHFDVKNQPSLDILEITFFRKRLAEGIPRGNFDYEHYKNIHKHIFQDIYNWAGKERIVAITKGESLFAVPNRIKPCMEIILKGLKNDNYLKTNNIEEFARKAAHYFSELNAVHPFREGNGRTLRLFMDEVAYNVGFRLDWNRVERGLYIKASIEGFKGKNDLMIQIFKDITQSSGNGFVNKVEDISFKANKPFEISSDLLKKITKYIDEALQYEKLLQKVFVNGKLAIDDEIVNALQMQKQSIKSAIYQVCGDKTWEVLCSSSSLNASDFSHNIDLLKVKEDIVKGHITPTLFYSISRHVKNNMLSYKSSNTIKKHEKL